MKNVATIEQAWSREGREFTRQLLHLPNWDALSALVEGYEQNLETRFVAPVDEKGLVHATTSEKHG